MNNEQTPPTEVEIGRMTFAMQQAEEAHSFDIVDHMCTASLDPETFEKWDVVRKELILTRRSLERWRK